MKNDKPSFIDYLKAKLKGNKTFITCTKTGRVYKELKADLFVKIFFLIQMTLVVIFTVLFITGVRIYIAFLIVPASALLFSPLSYFFQKFEEVDNNYYIAYGLDLKNNNTMQ